MFPAAISLPPPPVETHVCTCRYVMCTGCSASGLRIVQAGLHPPNRSREMMHPLYRDETRNPNCSVMFCHGEFMFRFVIHIAKWNSLKHSRMLLKVCSLRKIDGRVSAVANKRRDQFHLYSIIISLKLFPKLSVKICKRITNFHITSSISWKVNDYGDGLSAVAVANGLKRFSLRPCVQVRESGSKCRASATRIHAYGDPQL